MKPMLKAPGTKRLKLTYDELLSSFAFNFNLRRYTMRLYPAVLIIIRKADEGVGGELGGGGHGGGAGCRFTPHVHNDFSYFE